MCEIKPNKSEKIFLNLAYNRFYDLFDEMMNDKFWGKSSDYRFSKIILVFSVYAELLNYEPIRWSIEHIKKTRPPMEAEIGGELFKFLRNVLLHFPFFNTWDEVFVNKALVNWNKPGQSIDKFLKQYSGKKTIKYRFWEAAPKKMTYLSVNCPEEYNENEKIYLKDILSEKEGVKFSLILMRQILDIQVKSVDKVKS